MIARRRFCGTPENVTVSDAEVTMAQSFISAAGDFRPEDFTDSYREALETLVHSKAEGVPLAEEPEALKEAEVVDLVAALRASVEAAKKRQSPSARKRITWIRADLGRLSNSIRAADGQVFTRRISLAGFRFGDSRLESYTCSSRWWASRNCWRRGRRTGSQ